MNPDHHPIADGVRRTVGIAALRRLRRLVDAEEAQDQANARWAQRLGVVFIVAAALVLLWLAGKLN